jgi:tetratricopeptide (TPR) repeat protein
VTAPDPIPFLEVPRLLESSRPRPRVNWFWIAIGMLLLIVLGSSSVARQVPNGMQAVQVLTALAVVGLAIALTAITSHSVRQFRSEQQRVEWIGERVQLRQWDEAAMALEQYLSLPARTLQLRAQALVFLAAVLSRFHRFEDAITVQTNLLEEQLMDEASAAGLKVGRAMAMLREDHLFDADRAISELRRSPAAGSAGLALVEIYRDVKTGHPAEAVELFEQKLTLLRDQLGQRVADAYALAARAYDLLDQAPQAGGAFHNATLLAPVAELFRRYPEVEKLSGRYQPAPAPQEAA